MNKVVSFTGINTEPTCSEEQNPTKRDSDDLDPDRLHLASIKNRRLTPYVHVLKDTVEPVVILKVKRDKSNPQSTEEHLTTTTNEPAVVEIINESKNDPVTVITVGHKRQRLHFLSFKMKLFTLIYFTVFIILICVTMFTPLLERNVQYFLGALLGVYCLSYFIVFIMICNQYHQTQGQWTLTVNAERQPPNHSIPLQTVSTDSSG